MHPTLRNSPSTILALALLLGPGAQGTEPSSDPCYPYQGFINQIACCPTGCSTCGGPGCEAESLGADSCCVSVIVENAQGCGVDRPNAPCVIIDEPDILLTLSSTGSLVIAPNPDRRSRLDINSSGDIGVTAGSTASVLFGTGNDSRYFTWAGMRFAAAASSGPPCPLSVFGSSPLVLGDTSGLAPGLEPNQLTVSVAGFTGTNSGVMAMTDNDSEVTESVCYQVVVLDGDRNQISTDPKIYNKRATPTEEPKEEGEGTGGSEGPPHGPRS